MSEESAASGADRFERLGAQARALLARIERADTRGRAALRAAIDDAFQHPDARLDDRTRAALGALLAGEVTAIAGQIVGRVAPLGAQEDAFDHEPIVARLADAGLLRDSELMSECIARVRVELIAAALPSEASDAPDMPSILARLMLSSDAAVAAEARVLLSGENRRHDGRDAGGLPAELHQRLLWWTAAALRERAIDDADDPAALDRAIAAAALDTIAAHRDDARVEAAAMRLAAAIDAEADELPALIEEALRDGRLTLTIALIAHALGIGYASAREFVADPAGDRLVLVLRALELPRHAIARIGLRLAEADPRRDLDAFADALGAAMAIGPETARVAAAPLRLHPDYRAALAALRSGER